MTAPLWKKDDVPDQAQRRGVGYLDAGHHVGPEVHGRDFPAPCACYAGQQQHRERGGYATLRITGSELFRGVLCAGNRSRGIPCRSDVHSLDLACEPLVENFLLFLGEFRFLDLLVVFVQVGRMGQG